MEKHAFIDCFACIGVAARRYILTTAHRHSTLPRSSMAHRHGTPPRSPKHTAKLAHGTQSHARHGNSRFHSSPQHAHHGIPPRQPPQNCVPHNQRAQNMAVIYDTLYHKKIDLSPSFLKKIGKKDGKIEKNSTFFKKIRDKIREASEKLGISLKKLGISQKKLGVSLFFTTQAP